jgi:hypothetical protein
MHNRRIGKLDAKVAISGENVSDSRQIRRIQRNQLEWLAIERRQERRDRSWMLPQQPRDLRYDRPAGEERTPDALKLLDTRLMVCVGFR